MSGQAEGFKVTETGVWYHPPHDPTEDPKLPVWICGPLAVTAYTRNVDDEGWGRLLEFKDLEGHTHTWAMPVRLLHTESSEYRTVLADRGLVIASGHSRARDLLKDYIQSMNPSAWVRCVEHTGWQGGTFVLPDEVIGDTGGERVLLQTVSGSRHVYRQAGTLEDWKREVARLCVDNSRLVFSVSCAFASMLLGITRDENGGFHFRGISSQGKTTALAVASSVFGQGNLRQGGYIQTWRATGNGLEAVASLHNDTLLCLDEIKQVDPRDAGEIAYMLASGKGKGRAEKNCLARERQTWRILFLSTGEISLADHLAAAGKRAHAGQEVRLVDVPAVTGKYGVFEVLHGCEDGAAFSLAACQAAQTYYGVAAREFLRRLMVLDPAGRTERLGKDLDDLRREFLAYYVPAGASGQVQLVAMRFALVAGGGELATRLGITGWAQGEVLSGVVACFKAWLEARGGTGDLETQAALSQVRRFFELHGESRFTLWSTDSLDSQDPNRPTINRAGFRRVNARGETEFYVLPEVFKTEICTGFNSRSVVRVLVDKGLLLPATSGRFTRTERFPGLGNTSCYRFTTGVLGETE